MSDKAREDVLFIHGFISSSAFWTETLFPNFSNSVKSTYRLFAVDLLGFGRSPKPTDSLYTLREHLDMIERSVLEPYKVKSFHIVAHSLGCILALALAVKHPGSVKSLTLLAPVSPYKVFFFFLSLKNVYHLAWNFAHLICWRMNWFMKTLAAIFSSTQGRTSCTTCAENGSSTARVAGDILWCVSSLLVRAHQPDNLPSHMQEPPLVGISRQAGHQKQVQPQPTIF